MKNVKFLLSAACTLFAVAAMAQQDFSGPQYAKWGDTPEEREKNILNSNFLKESYDNRDYDAAARYLRDLLNSCPDASVAIYQRGANVYKQKINRAKNVTEKNAYIDSLMQIYDLRAKYFGDNAKQGLAFILDQKAREYLAYKPNDRAGIRKAFREALEAGGDNADPETVVAYFSNLCDDYKNTDEVMPDEVIAEYDRLSQFFEKHPEAAEMKGQFDTAFGVSGAASCENLEKLFGAKLAAAPDDEALLAQAVALMSRADCSSDFFLATAEKFYAVKPSSNTALSLAQVFQNKHDYAKAMTYLNEALAVEKDDAERQKLLARIGLVGLAANDVSGAAAAARQARGRRALLRAGAVLRPFGRFLWRFRRAGYLLGRLRHDVEGRRVAAERFGIPRARQERAFDVPQQLPQLRGVFLQRAAVRGALYGHLRHGCRCHHDGASPLKRTVPRCRWKNA